MELAGVQNLGSAYKGHGKFSAGFTLIVSDALGRKRREKINDVWLIKGLSTFIVGTITSVAPNILLETELVSGTSKEELQHTNDMNWSKDMKNTDPQNAVFGSPSLGLWLKPVFVVFGAALVTTTVQPAVPSTHRHAQDLVLWSRRGNTAGPARKARFSCSSAC